MANWIIDDFGGLHVSGSPEATLTIGYTEGGKAAENYAIENIGYVGLSAGEKSVSVRCRPALMSDKAISTLWYWLLDRSESPVVVAWLDDVWRVEHTMSCRLATLFLGYLLEKRITKPTPPHERLLSRLSKVGHGRWSRTVRETTSALDVSCEADTRRRALDHMYQGRWTLLEVQSDMSRFTTIDQGGGYPPLHPVAGREPRDFNIHDFGDHLYKEWILNNFVSVATSGRPKFEDVDAVVSWPRIGDMRTRYWRAVIPFQSFGSCRLLSLSGCDSSIDLRPNLVQVSG